MYLRIQIMDPEGATAVAALVVPAIAVTEATALRWAALIAKDADKRAGVAGHCVQGPTPFATLDKALTKLAGVRAGGGGNRTGAKPRGQCVQCGGVYPLDKLGLVSTHGKVYGTRSKKRCAGSKEKPRAVPVGAKAQRLITALEK